MEPAALYMGIDVAKAQLDIALASVYGDFAYQAIVRGHSGPKGRTHAGND
jgi:hypothetical protein